MKDTLFDIYITVDWSSRNVPSSIKPTSDAIWVAEKGEGQKESYFPTRLQCVQYLKEKLLLYASKNKRVFLGFDFAYGYPSGFAEAIRVKNNLPAWKQVWDELSKLIEDNSDNKNNRFVVSGKLNSLCGNNGPLWGCPVNTKINNLSPKSPLFPFRTKSGQILNRLRTVDRLESKIQPIWKIAYSASVGGQVLVGIPVVNKLRYDTHLDKFSKVWPFETGFTLNPTNAKGPSILHAEIWPGVIANRVDRDIKIKDQAQVRAMVNWLSELDHGGKLGKLFARPEGLSVAEVKKCTSEEGWIIGAGLKMSGVI